VRWMSIIALLFCVT